MTYDKDKERIRNAQPHRVAARAAYQAANPPAVLRKTRAWRKRNPEKAKAHWTVENNLRAGKIVKPTTCSKCGAEGRIEAHHEDYSKPLEVVWLCRKHHLDVHAQ
jgi:hypothetical protein